jgi:hypothetical protein
MKIGFTGTRNGMTYRQKTALRTILWSIGGEGNEFHHGDCIGADAEADRIARGPGMHIVIHPPTDSKARAYCGLDGDTVNPEFPYLERNRRIVDSTSLLIAAPEGPESVRSGTWSTVRYARQHGWSTIILDR